MDTYFSEDVLTGMRRAEDKARHKKNRLRIKVGEEVYPVLRSWSGGFSLPVEQAPSLRGFVDLYDGAKHLSQCLIIYSEVESGEMIYEYKRHTAVGKAMPVDFVQDPHAPVALLT